MGGIENVLQKVEKIQIVDISKTKLKKATFINTKLLENKTIWWTLPKLVHNLKSEASKKSHIR